MRAMQYKALMRALDAALDNGFDEVLEQEPDNIIDEIEDQTGMRFDDVRPDELYHAIRNWQERQS